MEPTIQHNSVLLIDKLTLNWRNAKKGEVVILKSLFEKDTYLCKRVMGVKGDNITTGFRSIDINDGEIWVEGDNSKVSMDSRSFGKLDDYLVMGLVRAVIYPEVKFI